MQILVVLGLRIDILIVLVSDVYKVSGISTHVQLQVIYHRMLTPYRLL